MVADMSDKSVRKLRFHDGHTPVVSERFNREELLDRYDRATGASSRRRVLLEVLLDIRQLLEESLKPLPVKGAVNVPPVVADAAPLSRKDAHTQLVVLMNRHGLKYRTHGMGQGEDGHASFFHLVHGTCLVPGDDPVQDLIILTTWLQDHELESD